MEEIKFKQFHDDAMKLIAAYEADCKRPEVNVDRQQIQKFVIKVTGPYINRQLPESKKDELSSYMMDSLWILRNHLLILGNYSKFGKDSNVTEEDAASICNGIVAFYIAVKTDKSNHHLSQFLEDIILGLGSLHNTIDDLKQEGSNELAEKLKEAYIKFNNAFDAFLKFDQTEGINFQQALKTFESSVNVAVESVVKSKIFDESSKRMHKGITGAIGVGILNALAVLFVLPGICLLLRAYEHYKLSPEERKYHSLWFRPDIDTGDIYRDISQVSTAKSRFFHSDEGSGAAAGASAEQVTPPSTSPAAAGAGSSEGGPSSSRPTDNKSGKPGKP